VRVLSVRRLNEGRVLLCACCTADFALICMMLAERRVLLRARLTYFFQTPYLND
jgi:hypothetical protein